MELTQQEKARAALCVRYIEKGLEIEFDKLDRKEQFTVQEQERFDELRALLGLYGGIIKKLEA